MMMYKLLKPKQIKENAFVLQFFFQISKWRFLSLFYLLTPLFAGVNSVKAEMTITA